ncbi:MAG: RnfABCDGE type electron transport complex subunit D [Chitinophagales bacterium]|nr:RnfABCDGE type electron transport complex subunit D [Chitinophagales bacterium]
METISLKTNRSSFEEVMSSPIKWLNSDPRHYQISFLGIFLFYGIEDLNWEMNWLNIAATLAASLLTQFLFTWFTNKNYQSLKSAIISALSLTLLLKTNLILVIMLAAFLSIASKFIFTFKIVEGKKHFFNPTNFGIILTILITGNAWISPGQWGSNALLVFGIGILGLAVLIKVKRLDVALAFFITFCLLNFTRSVLILGWQTDFFLHQFTSGTLLLFTFFMITDPVSTPSHSKARIVWAVLVAMLAFYLSAYEFVNGAPLWALFFISPTTILFDKIFLHPKFYWGPTNLPTKEAPNAQATQISKTFFTLKNQSI